MQRFKLIKKEDIKKLPEVPGVYVFKKGKQFLYIGKAINIRKRVKNHFQQPGFRDNMFLKETEKIGYIKTGSEIEALILEARLIKKYSPRFNVLWKDDKNYFFVVETREDFPRIFITHQPTKSAEPNKCIGPFVEGKALKNTLKTLRKVFPYRSCRKLPKTPCLWYQLNRCPAPCLLQSNLAKQIPNLETKIKKECQQNTKNLINILEGKKETVARNLKKKMKEEAKKQNFRSAARIKGQIETLERVLSHARILRFLAPLPQKQWGQTKKELASLFGTNADIERVEAYDISNIQGKQATGSMVVFLKGIPHKKSYRKFKIKTVNQANDTAMIREVLERRLRHKEWPYPQIILIDGGKGQLGAAKKAILQNRSKEAKEITLLALAKKKNDVFLRDKKEPIKFSSLKEPVQSLILWIRDESHRFAQKYHHKLREIDLRS